MRSLRKLSSVGVLGALFPLASCATGPEFDYGREGVVKQHEHTDAYTTFIPICTKTCTIVPIFHPETFRLVLEQCGHDEYKKENPDGCGDFTVDVTEETYSSTSDGQVIKLKG